MKASRIDQGRFEPTVFGAMRRYKLMVGIIAVLIALAAAGRAYLQPEVFRANATITVPQPSPADGQDGGQYVESQVLVLRSQEVAERAADLANATLKQTVLSSDDFTGENASLEIIPPQAGTPGAFGSSTVGLTFTWPNAKVAQLGVNSALQAFDDIRSYAIAAQGAADVGAIDRTIVDLRTQGQREDLQSQRTQMLLALQLELATHPTVVRATEPQIPINGNVKRSGAIGLLAGLVLGAALAYLRAARNRRLDDRHDPAAIYDAPLIGVIPPAEPNRIVPSLTAADPLPMAGDPQSPAAEAFRFTAGTVERIRAAGDRQLAVVFVSAHSGAGRSKVVANVALAAAESGTPVLAVDADASTGHLTDLLLPGTAPADGFEQVVAGRRPVSDCIETSPLNADVTVLRAGPTRARRTTGPAYAHAVEKMIAEAKTSFDLVLIDCPALLSAAHAVELVNDSDAAIIVLGSGESVDDHVTMVERLDQVDSNVAGYIYRRAGRVPRFARLLRERTDPSYPDFAFRSTQSPGTTARVPRG